MFVCACVCVRAWVARSIIRRLLHFSTALNLGLDLHDVIHELVLVDFARAILVHLREEEEEEEEDFGGGGGGGVYSES